MKSSLRSSFLYISLSLCLRIHIVCIAIEKEGFTLAHTPDLKKIKIFNGKAILMSRPERTAYDYAFELLKSDRPSSELLNCIFRTKENSSGETVLAFPFDSIIEIASGYHYGVFDKELIDLLTMLKEDETPIFTYAHIKLATKFYTFSDKTAKHQPAFLLTDESGNPLISPNDCERILEVLHHNRTARRLIAKDTIEYIEEEANRIVNDMDSVQKNEEEAAR